MDWQRVGRRGSRNTISRWDTYPYGGMQGRDKGVISTIYVSAFSDRSRAADLFRLFGCVGDVVEVVIPLKRNKFRKHFGFARFKNVEMERLLAVKLDNIIIDGRKIYANQPRFSREEGKGTENVRWQQQEIFTMKKENLKFKGKVSGVGSTSYAKVVKEGKQNVDVVEEEEHPFFSFNSDPFLKSRRKKDYIGEVMFSGESYNVQTHLEIEGFFLVKVSPLGANLYLLEEMEEGVIEELLNDPSTWWK